jgi:hypothetical protein
MEATTGAGIVFQRSWNYLPLELFPKLTWEVVVLTQAQLNFFAVGQRKTQNGRILEKNEKGQGIAPKNPGKAAQLNARGDDS